MAHKRIAKPEEIVLSNGIPVILQHLEGSVAATYWWVKTGSADESPAEAGFAHFLEHMLFKDAAAKETGLASSGQTARAIESLGGEINAYTSFDQTVYHVACAAQHWERVLDIFGRMAHPQRFLKADFDREREVILEELRKNEDSPERQLFQALFTTTYSRHPYGKPVIGYIKTLKAAGVSDLERFYRRNYISGNMGLILVGPIGDRRKLIRLLEKHYGAAVLPRKEIARKPRSQEPPVRQGVCLAKRAFDVATPALALSFRVPNFQDPDMPALNLMTNVLGMGESARLYQKLFYQTSLATDVQASLFVPGDPGVLYFQVEMDSVDKVNLGAEELFKELVRIREEGPTREELDRVYTNVESERLYATQTADGMAGRLGFLKFIMGDLDFDEHYLEELRQVDQAKMREVALKYLDFRRMSGSLLLPKAHAGFDLQALKAAAEKILNPGEPTKPVIEAPIRKRAIRKAAFPGELIVHSSGMKVLYYPRPQSQVASIHAAALGGLRLELAAPLEDATNDWGTSHMMSLTWTKGTSRFNSQAISGMVEGAAAGMEGFSGRNTVGLHLTCLARDWEKLSGLFAEVLMNPTYPENEVDHSRRVVEESIRSIEDHSSQLCSKLFLETLFEQHPYGRMTMGSLESIKTIDGHKLRNYHHLWVRPDRLALAVVGAVRRSELDSWLLQVEQQARAVEETEGAHRHQLLPGRLPEEPRLKAPRWVEKCLGREQCHVLAGGLGTTMLSNDRHKIRLMQTILGGQSGRLFIELREKKSLAYSVAPINFEGIERGYIGTYIACAPQKRAEAIEGIKAVLEKLAQKGPTDKEMKRAKEFFLGRRAMDLQSDSALASHYGLELVYGIEPKSDAEAAAEVEDIKAKDIQKVCEEYLVRPFMVTSTVG